jgi:Ser/Thr protein kinase RdoA (MazF antagonist)
MALADYGLSGATLRPLDGGLINKTFLVEARGERFILQSLNKIFAPSVHDDIEAITAHLESKGVTTPRLVRTQGGALWTQVGDEVFRVMTFVDGETLHRLDSPERAAGAGALVGQFHAALQDCAHHFFFTRPGAHDTAKHMAFLRETLGRQAAHLNYARVAAAAEDILRAYEALPALPALPLRIAHGDLKVSNILFAGNRGVALVDLDTMARLPLAIELGDALRSWCNPAAEDTTDTRFDSSLFAAAMRGYLPQASFITAEERAAIPLGVMTIALELAARFCADALNENYFGWNPQRFASRSEHNLIRGVGQLNVFKSLHAQALDAALIVR